jgi:hypothetical protein
MHILRLKNFIESKTAQNNSFKSILYPVFIYMCLDLIKNHNSIKKLLK